MSHYTLTRNAERDIADIWEYVTEDNPDAADSLLVLFYNRMRLIGNNPNLGPVHPQLEGDVRYSVVGHYVILYQAMDEGVKIFRVLHGRRNVPQILRDEPLDQDEEEFD